MAAEDILKRCDRFFTGNVIDVALELLQNSRRAGAKDVTISSSYVSEDVYRITYADNGIGVEDFNALLSLGRSHWDEQIVAAEDPAGMGFFSLAPREVTLRSRGKQVRVTHNVWFGTATANIVSDPSSSPGLTIEFEDKVDWGDDYYLRDILRFCPLNIVCNQRPLVKSEFFLKDSNSVTREFTDLGLMIEVTPVWKLPANKHVRGCRVNFYGLVVSDSAMLGPFKNNYVANVNMTGQMTPLRFVLPSRKVLVEDEAYDRLRRAVFETVADSARTSGHDLCYSDYVFAIKEGLDIPPAVDLSKDTILAIPRLADHPLGRVFPNDRITRNIADYAGSYRPFADVVHVHLSGNRELFENEHHLHVLPCDSIRVRVGFSDGTVEEKDVEDYISVGRSNRRLSVFGDNGECLVDGLYDSDSGLIIATIEELQDPDDLVEHLVTSRNMDQSDSDEVRNWLQEIGYSFGNREVLVNMRLFESVEECMARLDIPRPRQLIFDMNRRRVTMVTVEADKPSTESL